MPRHLLTDLHLKNIKPDDTRKRLNDGDGLFLLLSVKGGAHAWRFSYTINGTRKTLSLGTYPDTGLALARRKADEARAQVAAGTDPSDARKAARADREKKKAAQQREAAGLPALGSFEDVAREWLQEVIASRSARTTPSAPASAWNSTSSRGWGRWPYPPSGQSWTLTGACGPFRGTG